MNPTAHGLNELREYLDRGELSAVDVVEAHLAQIERLEPKIGAFLHTEKQGSIARARELDRIPKAERGALHGIPIAVKDIISVSDMPCTCGSQILKGYRALFHASTVERLLQAGAIVIGKTNLDEFAMGSSNENSSYFPTKNPWNLDFVPGGSSGGSAAAVAAHEAPLALGTDTGGSIRQPASLCGVVGLKPTYGRVSRYGLVAFASSLDQIGPITRNVRDAAIALSVIAGDDPRDSTCSAEPTQSYASKLEQTEKLRIGVPKQVHDDGLDPDVRDAFREALKTLEGLGAEVETVSLPAMEHAIACYYLLATAEASSNLARYDGVRYGTRKSGDKSLSEMISDTRQAGFGAEVKRRIILGTYVLSAGYADRYYQKAQRARTLIARDFDKAYERVDAIAMPTSPTPAFPFGERSADPLQMYLSDIFTITANLTGAPAISIPAGFSQTGLPIGLQLVGKHFDEQGLLQIAHRFESATDYHRKSPTLAEAT